MTVPSIHGWKEGWFGWLTILGLVLELSALGVLAYRQARDVLPDFIDAKREFALELDDHFVEYEHLRAWLRSMDPLVRSRRLAYVESRLESMTSRYPLIFGAVDKLGVLPVLAGLFFQLQAITKVSTVFGIVALMVLVLYVLALWMSRFRLQLQTYARLLKAADHE